MTNNFINWVMENKIEVTRHNKPCTQTLLKSCMIEVWDLKVKWYEFRYY